MLKRFAIAFTAIVMGLLAVLLTASRSGSQFLPQPAISPDNATKVAEVIRIGEQLKEVRQALWSPDGKSLIVVDELGASIYDAETMKPTRFIDPGLEVVGAAVFASVIAEQTLALGGAGTVQLWDMSKGELRRTLSVQIDPDYTVVAVAFSPDGAWAAMSNNFGGTLTYKTGLLNLGTGQLARTLDGGGDDLAFSANGRMLAMAAYDHIQWWDVTTGQRVNNFVLEPDPVRPIFGAVAFAPNGAMVAGAADDDRVRLWKVSDPRPARLFADDSIMLPMNVISYDVAFSPVASTLAYGSSDGTLRLWEIESGQLIRSAALGSDEVRSVTFSPDGEQLVVGLRSEVQIRETNSLQLVQQLTSAGGHLAFSPDGRYLASGNVYPDYDVHLWSVHSGKFIRSFEGGSEGYGIAFSPDGRTLATGVWDGARVWDADTGQLRYSLEAGEAAANLVFAPDGRTLMSAGGLWDLSTGQLRVPLEREGVMTISPDGKVLASGGCGQSVGDNRIQYCVEGRIILWEANTGQPLRSITAHAGHVRWVQFIENGHTLATVGGDTLEWREAGTGELMRTLTFHTTTNGGEVPFALSPDARLLAWGDGGLIRLWDANTGEELIALEGHRDAITDLTFSPDGRLLASSSHDGTIRVWAARWP